MNKKQMNHQARGGINNARKLNRVQQKAVSLRKSKSPVFDIDVHSHDFDQIKKSIVDIQMLNHPVYEIDGEHKFNEIPKNLFDSKTSKGPVPTVENVYLFYEVEKLVTGLKSLNDPVYDIEHRN